jgi:hypothetical protein
MFKPLLTPVAFLIFNRPDLTKQVFDRIAQAKPKKLLVVADGPRFPEEEEKCAQTREIVKKVNWDCEVLTNFSENNLGCRKRVSSGLDWVFSEVEEAIILEDDCLPALSFFSFCQSLLEYYRDDERIMHISGNNYLFDDDTQGYSYMFSRYPHIWGWASWRRAWKYYDVAISTWEQYKKQDILKYIFEDSYEQKYWINIFNSMFNDQIDTWDYQWAYACFMQNGLSILPTSNLISNLGFRTDSRLGITQSPWANLPTSDISKISHPPFVIRNQKLDGHTFDSVYGGIAIKEADTFRGKLRKHSFILKNRIRRLVIDPMGFFKSVVCKIQ